jgi:ADP-heptose:LPS heptosyltransferase
MCGAKVATFLPVRPPAYHPGHLTDLWASILGMPAMPTASGAVPPRRGRKHGPHSRSGVSPLSPDLAAPAAWPVPDAWRRQAAALLAKQSVDPARPFVVIHPGAGDQAKCWPLERFAAVASALREAGTPAVFVLGPIELERWGDAVVRPLCGRFPVVSGPELPALAGLLSAAARYLGNDSGSSHLAAAVGTPTVALFGPTDPRHFRPLGRCVRVVVAGTIDDIDVVDVVDAIVGMTSRG